MKEIKEQSEKPKDILDMKVSKHIDGVGDITLCSGKYARENFTEEVKHYSFSNYGILMCIDGAPVYEIITNDVLNKNGVLDENKFDNYEIKKTIKHMRRFRERQDIKRYDHDFIRQKLSIFVKKNIPFITKLENALFSTLNKDNTDQYADIFGYEATSFEEYVLEKRKRKEVLKSWIKEFGITIDQKSYRSNSIYGYFQRNGKYFKVRISDHGDSGNFSDIEPERTSGKLMLQIMEE